MSQDLHFKGGLGLFVLIFRIDNCRIRALDHRVDLAVANSVRVAAIAKVRYTHIGARGFLVLQLLALMALLTGCDSDSPKAERKEQLVTAISAAPSKAKKTLLSVDPELAWFKDIRTEAAVYRKLQFVVDATGQLQPNANAVTKISISIPGRVESISASVAEAVKAGQELARISSEIFSNIVF
jgi:hypothetical protein